MRISLRWRADRLRIPRRPTSRFPCTPAPDGVETTLSDFRIERADDGTASAHVYVEYSDEDDGWTWDYGPLEDGFNLSRSEISVADYVGDDESSGVAYAVKGCEPGAEVAFRTEFDGEEAFHDTQAAATATTGAATARMTAAPARRPCSSRVDGPRRAVPPTSEGDACGRLRPCVVLSSADRRSDRH